MFVIVSIVVGSFFSTQLCGNDWPGIFMPGYRVSQEELSYVPAFDPSGLFTFSPEVLQHELAEVNRASNVTTCMFAATGFALTAALSTKMSFTNKARIAVVLAGATGAALGQMIPPQTPGLYFGQLYALLGSSFVGTAFGALS